MTDQTRDSLNAAVDSLYAQQIVLRMHEEAYDEAWYEFREKNADAISGKAEAQGLVKELEALVRERALEVYRESGSKHPHAAVEIKEVKRLKYEYDQAHAWALGQILHLIPKKLWPAAQPYLDLMGLKGQAFEQVAKARMTDPDKTRRLDFVSYEIEPQTNVSKDLRDKVQSTEQQLQASINGRRGH